MYILDDLMETNHTVAGINLPRSCEEFRSRFPPGRDGDHWLGLPSGGEVIIYCHNMSSAPASYISLYEENFSQAWGNNKQWLYSYHKIGIDTDVSLLVQNAVQRHHLIIVEWATMHGMYECFNCIEIR